MTTQPTYQISPPEAAALVRRGGTILVETDARCAVDFEAVRRAAIAIATASGAEIVLFDRSTESLFTDPYPAGPWTADVDGPRGDRALEAHELGPLGREALRRQVERIGSDGVTVRAWLARGSHARAMAAAAHRLSPDVVLVKTDSRGSLLSRVRPARQDREQIGGAPVLTIDDSGAMVMCQRSCSIAARPRHAALAAG